MLRYSDDRRYILSFSSRTYKTTRLGPYDENTLPAIKNADGTERRIWSIPQKPEESVLYQYPELQQEFIKFTDPKYSNLTLKDIKPGCNYKSEFKCKTCNHKWIVMLKSHTRLEQGCPYCCKYKISFPENYIYYALKQVDSNLQENYRISEINTTEFDMYDPELKIAIEFNSDYSHASRQDLDNNKIQYAVSQNIRLIRIWQLTSVKQVDKLNDNEYIIPAKSSINGVKDIDIIVNDICEQYGLIQSSIDRQSASNQAFLRTNKNPPAGDSLLDQYPDICRDWDYTKNGVIKPQMLYPRSNIIVHWKCMYCGKEWMQQLNNRTATKKSLRAGCQRCNVKISYGILQEIPYIPYK